MNSFICQICSNGCNLQLNELAKGEIELTGNFCSGGIKFAASKIGPQVKIISRQTQDYDMPQIRRIASFWNIEVIKSLPDIMIQGSPERSLFRVVIEDIQKQQYILEKIKSEELVHKRQIAELLVGFFAKGLEVQPYMASNNGEPIREDSGAYWQIMPRLRVNTLLRDKYMFEDWRGAALADFLIKLRAISKELPVHSELPAFSLKQYIATLFRRISCEQESLATELLEIKNYLDITLFSSPMAQEFCHGDPHPLNIFWGASNIRAVIDWEFCGFKDELYDPALIIGCVGIDHPQSFQEGFIPEFMQKLEKSGIYFRSWDKIWKYVLAVRFAWLSEWLRREDKQMIATEVNYMKFIYNSFLVC